MEQVQGGKTPQVTNDEANQLGFRLVIWPCLGMEAVIPAYRNALNVLTKTGKPPVEENMGPTALFEVCGLRDLMEFDASVGGNAYGS
jgi:2-methylisocitrate lyase-like PEP mutase family enzyme